MSPRAPRIGRGRPLLLRLRNLQPDDERDFALMGSKGQILVLPKDSGQ
jgi:hypothetical protein